MSDGCRRDLGEAVAYACGELSPSDAERFEDHLFACPRCARRLEVVDRLRSAVSGAARDAALGVVVNRGFLDRAAADGLSWRDYRIEEGSSVACSAGPEDLVVVRLAGRFAGRGELRLDGTFEDLESGASTPLPPREVLADHDLDEVVLAFPGETVRAYPRSRWTLRLRTPGGDLPAAATYVMDHTPIAR